MPTLKKLKLKFLRTDGGTQQRVALSEATVEEYAQLLAEKVKLPPAAAVWDGAYYWLYRGFHRLAAHEAAQRDTIEVEVRDGTLRDAILLSIGENATHGLRRSNADKRKAVQALLDDEEWATWSNRRIAETAGVSDMFVASLRRDPGANGLHLDEPDTGDPGANRLHLDEPEPPPRRIGKDNKSYPVPPIDKGPMAEAAAQPPEAPEADEDACDSDDAGLGDEPDVPAKAASPIANGWRDQIGLPIPEKLQAVFANREAVAEAIRLGRQLGDKIHQIAAAKAGAQYRRFIKSKANGDHAVRFQDERVLDALNCLAHQQPHVAACPRCCRLAQPDPKCPCCCGFGWLTESSFKKLSPLEVAVLESLRDGTGGAP